MKKNKILSILLSLVIAFGLWIYVVSTVTTDDSQWVYNIPVTFVNEDGLFSDRNLTLKEGRDATVNLKFYGSRQALSKLNNTNVTVSVDLSQVTAPGDWNLVYETQFPESVNENEISIESRSKATIYIEVDKLETKAVEVRRSLTAMWPKAMCRSPSRWNMRPLILAAQKNWWQRFLMPWSHWNGPI